MHTKIFFQQGIGALAMEFAFDKVQGLGKRFICLWVLTENESSIKFYEKCGFKANGKTKLQERGKTMKIIQMKKDLCLSQ